MKPKIIIMGRNKKNVIVSTPSTQSTSSNKSYVNWVMQNCGGVSVHGTESCYQETSLHDGTLVTGPCTCVNPPHMNCPLYMKLGISSRTWKPYLNGSLRKSTWKDWGPIVLKQYPHDFPAEMNAETIKKQWQKALDYTKAKLNLTPETAGIETHPDITPLLKLYKGIFEEMERDRLEKQVGAMINGAKQDSMLTFEATTLRLPQSIGGKLSASLSSKRSSPSNSSERDVDSQEDVEDLIPPSALDDFDGSGGDKLVSAEDAEEAVARAVSNSSTVKLRQKLADGVEKSAYKDKIRPRKERKSTALAEAEKRNSTMIDLVESFLPKKRSLEEEDSKQRSKIELFNQKASLEKYRMKHEMDMMKMQLKMQKYQMQQRMAMMMGGHHQQLPMSTSSTSSNSFAGGGYSLLDTPIYHSPPNENYSSSSAYNHHPITTNNTSLEQSLLSSSTSSDSEDEI